MEPIEIQDTSHMSNFVHQLYISNMEQMKENYKLHMKEFFNARKVFCCMQSDSGYFVV